MARPAQEANIESEFAQRTTMFGLEPGTIGLLVSVLGFLLGVAASVHILLHKRRPESAFGWLGVSFLLPIAGPFLYYVFGINRVRTRATKLRQGDPPAALTAQRNDSRGTISAASGSPLPGPDKHKVLASDATGEMDSGAPDEALGLLPTTIESGSIPLEGHTGVSGIARSGERVGAGPLTDGNRVGVLHNGEEAFPAMLEAIQEAQRHVYLSTYIFENNDSGIEFVDALQAAVNRGVIVRVLLDGIGELYSRPPLRHLLRSRKIPYARFLPPQLVPPSFRVNLRNHRKILVADGEVAFVGGINIGDRHRADQTGNPDRVVDLHFGVEGPVVEQIEAVFLRDWLFASGEELPPTSFSDARRGPCVCSTLADGPDEGIDRLVALLLSAIGAARERVLIMTPYFVPPRELMGMLQSAALRGVDVAVILPEKNNLPYVDRATRHMAWELLRRDVKIYYQPPPFVHSKLMVIDETYSQVGSANWDARSLRLNFELALEVYDAAFTTELARHFEDVRSRSRALSLEDVDGRSIGRKLVDGLCWMMSPYL